MQTHWPEAVGRKLGIAGAVDFTITRVGQTLHLPCAAGNHRVDVEIQPGLPPDALAKRLIAKGWTLGRRKLRCPACQRKKAPGRVAHMERVNAERWGGNGKDEGMGSVLEALQAPQPEEPKPSEAAGKGRRGIYILLEFDAYDAERKRYKPGWNDKRVAEETSMSEAEVKRIREADFGPIGEPPEIAELRAEIGKTETTLAALRSAVQSGERQVFSLKERFEGICQKHGFGA